MKTALILAIVASASFAPPGAGGELAPGAPRRTAPQDRLMADACSLDGYDLLPKLRSLTIPTLVIYGDHDFIPSFVAEHIAEALPAARFVTTKDCGHFAYLECPGPVRKEIDGFFRGPSVQPKR